MKLSISEIIQATGGSLLCGTEDTAIKSFFSDSREAVNGGMFVPFRGDRTDSHRFIESVLSGDAAASFSETEMDFASDKHKPVVLVQDSRRALQKSAAYYRDQFSIPIVGVTGSAGKTTAKEMIALAVSSHLKTLKTAGNQNSQIGVPLTVCNLKKEHQAAVVEMGVSMPGEMTRLAEVVKPGLAVITNIGVSHIEFLKSRENIMAEKLHITDYIGQDGVLFVNGDDDLLSTLKSAAKCRVVSFGTAKDCDWRASAIRQVEGGMFFTCEHAGKSTEVFLPAVGVHNVRNALASLSVASRLGVPAENAVRALAAYKAPAMRQQIFNLANGITLIDDSYNANPDSMRGAIDTLSTLKGRRIAVLGDMLELGSHSNTAHEQIGSYAAEKDTDILVAVGGFADKLCGGFGSADCYRLSTAKEAAELLPQLLNPGDSVLIKGSRGIHLEEVVGTLRQWKTEN